MRESTCVGCTSSMERSTSLGTRDLSATRRTWASGVMASLRNPRTYGRVRLIINGAFTVLNRSCRNVFRVVMKTQLQRLAYFSRSKFTNRFETISLWLKCISTTCGHAMMKSIFKMNVFFSLFSILFLIHPRVMSGVLISILFHSERAMEFDWKIHRFVFWAMSINHVKL